jgi:hypothetical protein
MTQLEPDQGAGTFEEAQRRSQALRAELSANPSNYRVLTGDRPTGAEVANLLLLISLCTSEAPEVVAARIGNGGSGALKNALTEAVNEMTPAPVRGAGCGAEILVRIQTWIRVLDHPPHSGSYGTAQQPLVARSIRGRPFRRAK